MNPSKFLSVNERDAIKSAITAFIGAGVFVFGKTLIVIFDSGRMPTMPELGTAAVLGLGAGVASIMRRFFSGEK